MWSMESQQSDTTERLKLDYIPGTVLGVEDATLQRTGAVLLSHMHSWVSSRTVISMKVF